MADIVRLEENGVTKYIETHAQAVSGLLEFINNKSQETVILYDGISTAKGIYFDETQNYNLDPNRELLALTIVFSRYAVGEGVRNYSFSPVVIPGDIVREFQKVSPASTRHTFQWGVASTNQSFKEIEFTKSGFGGSARNKETIANGPDNRVMVARYISATYKNK
ncbi:hypothetical protein DOK76_12440 [Vagococcus sp. DIV0080]|uniref:Uncharacterized protein n=1 Tax=Candidatus Vagococcus giribetii TaxID=2230876 RepID=A0ABS3HVV2_9ENTE|nr:hypothetical protein [Vagococcus sp. DIV0080]MBO0477882.1 hypothetical protein [Vagococcus sp. DIV0080]